MYTPIQLEAIKLFGMKELTDGCIITGLCLDQYGETKDRRLCIKTYAGYYLVSSKKGNFHDNCGIVHKPSSIEILGHIPHLEDLFRVAEERGVYISISPEITRVYKEFGGEPIEIVLVPQTPLLDQPSLPEIISLFK